MYFMILPIVMCNFVSIKIIIIIIIIIIILELSRSFSILTLSQVESQGIYPLIVFALLYFVCQLNYNVSRSVQLIIYALIGLLALPVQYVFSIRYVLPIHFSKLFSPLA